ncbi:GT2 family glycosyltransferase/glycosyltransferase involved in cell wall biosynthesis [Actinopolyspora lacussalsi]|nr:GT2 family glycosyltransferase/glycosyltransferase involved in cell wall biosynthesis [Actinopolyspora lacussalsi]
MADPGNSAELPMVSVITVNYHGTESTITCLNAARELDYPPDRLELICVDNESSTENAERLGALDGVKLLTSRENLGFAGGCNLGAREANGTVLAFLNNDAVPDPKWSRAAVEVLRAEPTVGAVAGKVLDWQGSRIDFVDGGLTWFGMGYKRHAGELDDGSHDGARDVLFGTGSSLFVRAELFRALGGFDERFFMFYEDVDLGWRLNLRGWRVRYEPTSVAYHRHHESMAAVSSAREHYLLERNALAALYKNVSEATLARALPAALALSVRRSTARGELDPHQLELDRRPADPREDETPVPVDRQALAGVLAIDRFVDLLPEFNRAREVEQRERVRSDADLVPLLRKAMEPAYPLPRYLAAHDALVEAFELETVFGGSRRIAVLTGDAITERMAGPAIRAWHTAEALAVEHEVRLISVNAEVAPVDADFTVLRAAPRDLPSHVDWADIVVVQGHVLEMVPALRRQDSGTIVVCDIYDPMHLELLEQGRDTDEQRRDADLRGTTEVLNKQLRRGDFFLCASQRQRHFWLGHLAALGRITPSVYDDDPTMRSMISVVPFGLPNRPPTRTGPGIRGQREGIGAEDKIVLWAGGVYSWFDPLTLLHAVHRLSEHHPELRLFFLGMRHPNPDVPEMGMADRTRELSDRLGLTDKHVFFNETWVPYEQRQNYLLDADCGVTTHFEHVETTFAFRTRMLDYLWAGLPVVTTDGDSFADLVRDERLGVVVPAEDPDALANALERVLYDEPFIQGCEERIAGVRERFTWETALRPLTEFCRDPRPAPDRLPASAPLTRTPRKSRTAALREDVGLLREYLDRGGIREVTKRAAGRLRRVAAQRLRGRGNS